MNKTVSASISGLMFVLEEEAFSRLSQYLHDLRSYFSGREGEDEIIADIESRIAELLQSRLSDNKQVINLQDVDWVVGVLGQPWQMDEEKGEDAMPGTEEKFNQQEPRRLYRDLKNAKIEGVAAGLANYFRIDPVVPRILFVILLLASGIGVLIYLIMWMLVPAMPSDLNTGSTGQFKEGLNRSSYKQLFRDTEHKKLAGVAAGLGHYFNLDPLVFRLLFVVFTFISGIGIIAYLTLWILTPEAQTTAEKLRMKGQPVNIENIERNIKEEAERLGRKMSQMGVEAGQGLRRAGRQAGPVMGSLLKTFAHIVSILVGIVFFLIGTSLFFVLMAFISGWEGFTFFEDVEIPFAISNVVSLFITDPGLSQLAGISLGAFVLIPVVMLVYVSLRLIIGSSFHLPGLGNIAGVLWALSIIGLGYSAYHVGSDFRETAKTELVNKQIDNNKRLVLIAKEVRTKKNEPILIIDNQRYILESTGEKENLLIMPYLYIEAVEAGQSPELKVEASAKGEDEDLARERSRNIEFPVEYRNDTLFVPVWFRIDASEGLHSQRISLRVSVPDSTSVQFDSALDNFFRNNPRSFWQSREFAGRSFMLTRNGFEKPGL